MTQQCCADHLESEQLELCKASAQCSTGLSHKVLDPPKTLGKYETINGLPDGLGTYRFVEYAPVGRWWGMASVLHPCTRPTVRPSAAGVRWHAERSSLIYGGAALHAAPLVPTCVQKRPRRRDTQCEPAKSISPTSVTDVARSVRSHMTSQPLFRHALNARGVGQHASWTPFQQPDAIERNTAAIRAGSATWPCPFSTPGQAPPVTCTRGFESRRRCRLATSRPGLTCLIRSALTSLPTTHYPRSIKRGQPPLIDCS